MHMQNLSSCSFPLRPCRGSRAHLASLRLCGKFFRSATLARNPLCVFASLREMPALRPLRPLRETLFASSRQILSLCVKAFLLALNFEL